MNCDNICLNTDTTIQLKNILCSWLSDINPQYFLSIQFPTNQRTADLTSANKKLRKIMQRFEKNILGRHWNRKHIPFIAIAEHGKSPNWHYHVLIYNCPLSFLGVQLKTHEILSDLNLPSETLYIEPVNNSGACGYTSKEFIADSNFHFDSDRIITSEILFNLSHKSSEYAQNQQKQPQNHRK